MSVKISETEYNFLAVNGKEVYIGDDGTVSSKEELTTNETKALREYLNSRERNSEANDSASATVSFFSDLIVIRLGATYTPKNKLEEAFTAQLKQLDGIAFDACYFEEFKKSMQLCVSYFNEFHKRCKPIRVDFSDLRDFDGHTVTMNGNYSAILYVDFVIKRKSWDIPF